METHELKRIVEAMIFVAEEPMTIGALELVFAESGVEKSALREAIDAIMADYHTREGGIELREVAGGYQFRTKPSVANWIQRLNVPKPTRLSQAAMETLAIIAYRQPTVRAEIEDIRGVDCGGVLKTLLERNVIKIVGKREEPGTPLLYGTTKEFLSLFNLSSLSDLPSLREYRELEHPSAANAEVPADAATTEGLENIPIAPISVESQIAMETHDQEVIEELEEQIRSLRHIEREIFPKPTQDFAFVDEDGVVQLPSDPPADTEESAPKDGFPS